MNKRNFSKNDIAKILSDYIIIIIVIVIVIVVVVAVVVVIVSHQGFM